MRVDDAGDRDPAARELLDDHRVGRQVEPHPAVLLGDRDPEQPELLHLLDDRLRELVRAVVVLGLGDDLLVDELADHLDDRLLLVGLLEGGRGDGHRAEHTPRRARTRRFPRTLAAMNFAATSSRPAPPGGARWSTLARDGARREWTMGEVAARRPRARRRAARARRAARRRRPDAARQPARVGADDGRLLPPGLRRAAVHRAAAAEGPAAAPRGRAPALVVADERNADALAAAGWDGPVLWAPWSALPARRRRRRPPSSARRSVPDHVHVRHRRRAEGRAARPALPRRPAPAGRALARAARRASSSGARRPRAGRSRRATRSSRRGCAAPRRSCTTRASTRTSGSSCSSASASNVLCMAPTEYRVIAKRAEPRPVRRCAGSSRPARRSTPEVLGALARRDRAVDPRRLRPDRDRPAHRHAARRAGAARARWAGRCRASGSASTTASSCSTPRPTRRSSCATSARSRPPGRGGPATACAPTTTASSSSRAAPTT